MYQMIFLIGIVRLTLNVQNAGVGFIEDRILSLQVYRHNISTNVSNVDGLVSLTIRGEQDV